MSITVVCKLVGSCLSAHRAVHLWYGYSCIMHRAHVMGVGMLWLQLPL